MPWQLEIHLIDVGQGDSTLLVADNGAGVRRSMLIDGGEAVYSTFVHDYIANTVGLAAVDHIVCTHYDQDHRGGLLALLQADDLTDLATEMGAAAAQEAVLGFNREEEIAGATAAADAVALGNFGGNAAGFVNAANNARNTTVGGETDLQAQNIGVIDGDLQGNPFGVASLVPNQNNRHRAAKAAGVQAANSILAGLGGAALRTAVTTAVFNSLRGGMPVRARFQTGNMFNATHVIDLGGVGVPGGWVGAINGNFTVHTNATAAPTVNRNRTSIPNLGDEVLWGSGPAAMVPPANAPEVYVVTRSGWAWQGLHNAFFQIPAAGIAGNNTSIGLVVRFNNFFYTTLGDMATNGEDPTMNAIMGNGLPNPAGGGGALALPPRVVSFKCSHHGAGTSTSQAYLNAANPRTALISTGFNHHHQHPAVALANRLHGQVSISSFYLTNCNFQTAVIAASMGNNQLTTVGNKSRVAGDNATPNSAAGRNRGDIRLRVYQAGSQAPVGNVARRYHMRYWDDDLAGGAGPRGVAIRF
ncbi:MBL fold metallo-hydrolase [Catenulispora rubra]|uniref:MBL fold metallo-hydrolase n=1 Tax=Catenulispora rubra TaxID=280293 RepID=UPI001892421A|nr:MBL fold metallo-hydrolase [Catenulispora rubra]